MIQDERIRLYSTNNIGIARKNSSDSFLECQKSLISFEDVGIIWLVFSAEALQKNGLINGFTLGFKRIFKCHPFEKLGGGDGIDFVPTLKNVSKKNKGNENG